jgi:hypothetical protein
LEKEDGEA